MDPPISSIRDLKPGRTYRVIRQFTDYDGFVHSAGETWIFEKMNFVPYNDGLTLHIIKDGNTIVYRLMWVQEEQQYIIEHPHEFIASYL
jgi:hypothetical protein